MNRVGDTSAVIYLLENGATNDHVNKRGNTALHFAVRFGFDTIVNAILEKFPSELERKNIFGHTPLWIAFDTKNLKISRLLLPKSPENPVYHWLTSQGKVGDEGLELIKQHYDIKDVSSH
jgi:ankyrin repeat protein